MNPTKHTPLPLEKAAEKAVREIMKIEVKKRRKAQYNLNQYISDQVLKTKRRLYQW